MSMPQYRHYLALLDLFKLKPSKESKEFGDLAMFMAQVCCIADTYWGSRLNRSRLGGLCLACDFVTLAAPAGR